MGLKLCFLLICLFFGDVRGIKYPEIHRDETVLNTYNEVNVTRPYGWMEDVDNSDKVDKLIVQEIGTTNDYISECKGRQNYTESVQSYKNLPIYDSARKFGDKYGYTVQLGRKEKAFWNILDYKNSTPRELNYTLENGFISPDASLIAHFDPAREQLSISNITDFQDVVIDAVNLPGWKMNAQRLAWLPDSSGFFYVSRQDGEHVVNFHKIKHTLGNETVDDETLIYAAYSTLCHGSEKKNGTNCVIQKLKITDDGEFLFVESRYETVDEMDEDSFVTVGNYVLVRINQTSLLESVLINVKTAVEPNSLHLFAKKDDKLYFWERNTVSYGISEVTIIPGDTIEWRIIHAFQNFKIVDVVPVGGDKMLIQLVDNSSPSSTVIFQLRDLITDRLIRTVPLSSVQSSQILQLSGRLSDSEVVVIRRTLQTFSEILILNASKEKEDSELVTVLKPLPLPSSHLFTLSYTSTNNDTNSTTTTHRKATVWVKNIRKIAETDFLIPTSAPTVILLNSKKYLKRDTVPALLGFADAIVKHDFLQSKDDDMGNRTHRNLTADWVRMEDEVQNVIDLGEELINQGYAKGGEQLYLLGLGGDATLLAGLVLHRRPEMFGAVVLSGIDSEFAPEREAFKSYTVCPDGEEFYGVVCSKVNSKLFPLLEQASPTLLLQESNVTSDSSSTRPVVLVNIVREKSHKEQQDDHINWNIFGLEYLAELQNKYGGGLDEKTKPSLLLVSKENQGHVSQLPNWEDVYCILNEGEEHKE